MFNVSSNLEYSRVWYPAALQYLKKLITTHHPVLVGIMEPKQHASKIDEYAQKFGFPKYAHALPVDCHIWLFWVQEVDIMVLDSSDQHITVQVEGMRIQAVFHSSMLNVRTLNGMNCGITSVQTIFLIYLG